MALGWGLWEAPARFFLTSAAIAVTLAMRKRGQNWIPFLVIAIVFAYTTIQNIHERPEGIKIASFFILAIVVASLVSRVWRSTELRVERIELDDQAREFIRQAARGIVRIIANRRDTGDALEYEIKEREKRTDNHIPADEPILFFEVTPGDASEFSGVLQIRGEKVDGYKILRAVSPAVPNAQSSGLCWRFFFFLGPPPGPPQGRRGGATALLAVGFCGGPPSVARPARKQERQ